MATRSRPVGKSRARPTVQSAPPSRSVPEILAARLAALRAERSRVLAEITPAPPDGDVADRATNVDANIRRTLIDRRISAVEAELAALAQRPAAPAAAGPATSDPGLAIGDTITADFGDGPEEFVFAPVELAEEGYE